MKSIVISVLLFSLALFLVNCEFESQPTQNPSDVENQILKKKPKPVENPTSELITFVGDLAGSQVVEGCCPNAGPYPEYKMTLGEGPFPTGISGRVLDGNIFMNKVGKGKNKSYMVQYWWADTDGDYFIEIRGGVFQEDKIAKTLTATFTAVSCKIWTDDVLTTIVPVTFVLTRAPAPQ